MIRTLGNPGYSKSTHFFPFIDLEATAQTEAVIDRENNQLWCSYPFTDLRVAIHFASIAHLREIKQTSAGNIGRNIFHLLFNSQIFLLCFTRPNHMMDSLAPGESVFKYFDLVSPIESDAWLNSEERTGSQYQSASFIRGIASKLLATQILASTPDEIQQRNAIIVQWLEAYIEQLFQKYTEANRSEELCEDLCARDKDGKTPIDYAVKNITAMTDLRSKKQCALLLLKKLEPFSTNSKIAAEAAKLKMLSIELTQDETLLSRQLINVFNYFTTYKFLRSARTGTSQMFARSPNDDFNKRATHFLLLVEYLLGDIAYDTRIATENFSSRSIVSYNSLVEPLRTSSPLNKEESQRVFQELYNMATTTCTVDEHGQAKPEVFVSFISRLQEKLAPFYNNAATDKKPSAQESEYLTVPRARPLPTAVMGNNF